MISTVEFSTIINQTNAAMKAEKNGHVMGGWMEGDVCVCIKCRKYLQLIGTDATGYAIQERCPEVAG